MASVKTTNVKMEQNTMSKALLFVAATAITDGFEIPYNDRDDKTVIIAKNEHATTASTLTIRSGNGIQGVSDTEAFPIAAGEMKVINLESGKYKHVSGLNKGNVVAIPGSTDIKLSVVVLP